MFGLKLCTGKTEQVPSFYNRERLSKSFPHTAALMNTWLLEFLCMTCRRSISQSPAYGGGEELQVHPSVEEFWQLVCSREGEIFSFTCSAPDR